MINELCTVNGSTTEAFMGKAWETQTCKQMWFCCAWNAVFSVVYFVPFQHHTISLKPFKNGHLIQNALNFRTAEACTFHFSLSMLNSSWYCKMNILILPYFSQSHSKYKAHAWMSLVFQKSNMIHYNETDLTIWCASCPSIDGIQQITLK